MFLNVKDSWLLIEDFIPSIWNCWHNIENHNKDNPDKYSHEDYLNQEDHDKVDCNKDDYDRDNHNKNQKQPGLRWPQQGKSGQRQQ